MARKLPIALGAHIEVRDAVWRVVQVNQTSGGTAAQHFVGLSEIVRDHEAIFLQEVLEEGARLRRVSGASRSCGHDQRAVEEALKRSHEVSGMKWRPRKGTPSLRERGSDRPRDRVFSRPSRRAEATRRSRLGSAAAGWPRSRA